MTTLKLSSRTITIPLQDGTAKVFDMESYKGIPYDDGDLALALSHEWHGPVHPTVKQSASNFLIALEDFWDTLRDFDIERG